ncbi:MAG: hypothetical protein HYX87_00345 [Chloroflexi bacterium]|nr:hypothetical protein [Chloroflexota bacterium]
MKLSIFLYGEPLATTLDLAEVSRHLRQELPAASVEARDSFVTHYLASLPDNIRDDALTDLSRRIAATKVRHLNSPRLAGSALPGEIQYEERRLEGATNRSFGIMYGGFAMMQTFQSLIPRTERSLHCLHIVFSNQIYGTWEDGDRRNHARAIICGHPSIISTTGIVEAPAKPREYYLLKQEYQSLGMYDAEARLAQQFQGQFIDHEDRRLTEASKGYVLQALFHHLTGDAFCDSSDCRLYNAHWQKELVHAQLESGRLCQAHAEQLRRMNEDIDMPILAQDKLL